MENVEIVNTKQQDIRRRKNEALKRWRDKNVERRREEARAYYHKNKKAISERNRVRTGIFRAQHLARSAVYRAKTGGLACESVEFITDFIQQGLDRSTCECCGVEFSSSEERKVNDRRSPSLDRLLPTKGYIAGNMAVICLFCNILKRDATSEEVQKVASWMKEKGL